MRSHENHIVVGGRKADDMFDALQTDRLHGVPVECIDEQRFQSSKLFGNAPFGTVKNQTRLDARADFIVLELLQTFVPGNAQLDHVEQLHFEHATQYEIVGPLLRRRTEHEQGTFVFVG